MNPLYKAFSHNVLFNSSRIIAFILLLTLQLQIKAGNDNRNLGAQSAAMGSTGVSSSSVFSSFSNAGALGGLETMAFSVYAENRFLQSSLSLYSLAGALPTKSGNFGLGVYYFGDANFNEKSVSLAYGRKLFTGLYMGASFDMISYSFKDYGSSFSPTFSIGILSSPTDKLNIGVNVHNPIRLNVGDDEFDRIPTIINLGLSYMPTEKIHLAFEVEKNINFKPQFKMGLEYHIVEMLYLRGGVSTNPTLSSFGLGFKFSMVEIDLANSFHPQLGYSPHITLSFSK